jgi:hypothetical protein
VFRSERFRLYRQPELETHAAAHTRAVIIPISAWCVRFAERTSKHMRPKAHDLAMRDPALAASLGGLPGADYGVDRGPSGFRGRNADFGISSFDPSRNIGFGFGVDAPLAMVPPPPPHPMAPHPHGHHGHGGHYGVYGGYPGYAGYPPFYDGRHGYYGHGVPGGPPPGDAAAIWHAEQAESARRARLLDPNEHSRLKIERYSFSLSPALSFTIGLVNAAATFEATLQPNTRIRAQRVLANVPTVNFVLLSTLQIANVNVFVGTTEDAFTYAATGQGVMLDLPTLDPANRATVAGNYTGLVPTGFAAEFPFQFIVTFQGPSTMVGGL